MSSRKCEHGMMPWECSYCDEIEKTEEARKYRNSIIAECIEAVKAEPEITDSSSSYRHGYARCSRDNELSLEQLKK